MATTYDGYTFQSPFGAMLWPLFAPWATLHLAVWVDAAGSCFDGMYELVAETGSDGDAAYTPSWGALFDVTQCPTEDLPYLAQYVGVAIPQTASDTVARNLIQAEAGKGRGTLASIQAAVANAIASTWQPSTAYVAGNYVTYQTSPGVIGYFLSNGSFTSPSTFLYPLPPANLVLDPSFEYDTLGSAPSSSFWTHNVLNGSATTYAVQNGWSSSGTKSLRVATTYTSTPSSEYQVLTPTGTNGFPVVAGLPYSASAVTNLLSAAGSVVLDLQLDFYNSAGTILNSGTANSLVTVSTPGIRTLTINGAIAPPGAVTAAVMVQTLPGATGLYDYYMDSIQVRQAATCPTYADGDAYPLLWSGATGGSTSLPRWTQVSQPSFSILERIGPSGADPYYLTIVVPNNTLVPIVRAALATATPPVKPAGILLNVVSATSATWGAAVKTWGGVAAGVSWGNASSGQV